MIDWQQIDTVLLDMDGTLIDLEFDSVFWNQLLPRRYAEHHGVDQREATRRFDAHIATVRHQLAYYCIDTWSAFTGLDVAAMKEELSHLIRLRPHAEQFVRALQRRGKDVRVVTNAHQKSLTIKDRLTGIASRIPNWYSSHALGHAKEHVDFWRQLNTIHPFDAARTLLIDDSQPVLEAARRYGIVYLLAIRHPDSSAPPRDVEGFTNIDGFDQLV